MMRYNARDIMRCTEDQVWQIPEEDIEVVCDDGIVQTFTQALVFSYYCWETHRRFPETPLLKSHITTDELLTRGSHRSLLGPINKLCVQTYQKKGDFIPMKVLGKIAFEVTMAIQNAIKTRIQSCVSSICAVDLVAIMKHPQIFAANEHVKALPKVTKTDTDAANAIAERVLMKDPGLRYNNIAKGVRSGIIKSNQVLQCVSPRGCVSDINSSVFPNPIRVGFAEGFSLLADPMMDSRAATRSTLMTKGAMRDAEYTNRQIQLTATAIKHVTYDDCGTKRYMPFFIGNQRTLYDMEGIFYLDEEDGNEYPLTRACTRYIGKTIRIRSVFTCEHPDTDTICGRCFGELNYNVPEGANIGYLAAVQVQSPTGQLILSNKHYEGSAAVMDVIFAEEDRQYIYVMEGTNSIHFTPALYQRPFKIIIDSDEAKNLPDIRFADNIHGLNIHRITSMRCVQIEHEVSPDRDWTSCVIGVSCGSRMASLSHEMLQYIRVKGWELTENGDYCIDMTDWDISAPFAVLPLKNFSTEEYAKAIETFIMGSASVKDGGVKNLKSVMHYKTPSEMVTAFHDLISQKLNVHHIWLQILVLSTMTTNPTKRDYRIPQNREAGIPGHYNKVISYRSLGPGYAYERQARLVYSPSSFLLRDRPDNPMDDLFLE